MKNLLLDIHIYLSLAFGAGSIASLVLGR